MNKFLAIVLIGLAIVLSGCNTWRGFGKDVEKVGDKIQNAPNN